ncbi:MAG: GntR family transcriptional regulator [Deltaproteobacteria bacterium]|nr:GntR family transcriptional regulator [Deltaproteobacteria bacterium]MCW5808263.1 GntR family transcriptional regulator [Deltaproteobacteria bacterium]
MVVSRPVSKVTEVLDRLRTEIVHGRLPPGEKLRLEHLAPRFGAGRTPLREACCRLVAEGLVTTEDQRGFRVATISRDDLLDLTRTRQQIEALALRASIQHGDLAWEGEVTAALHRLQRLGAPAKQGQLDEAWEREHGRLHGVLLAACRSPQLLRFHAILFEQSERYRRLAAAYGQPARDIGGEHAALVRAALARDAERACALLVEHIALTSERVLACYPGLLSEKVDKK